jgi:hypothetical protein
MDETKRRKYLDGEPSPIAHLRVNNYLTIPASHHTCNCSITHKLTATYRDIVCKNVPVYDYSVYICG